MSGPPLTRAVLTSVLADFHRDVVLPDVERVVGTAIDQMRSEMNAHFDDAYHRFERLEDEYQAIKSGVRRAEERLDGVDSRLGRLEAAVMELRTRVGRVEERLEELIALEEKYPLRAEVQDLKTRVERLHEDVRRLEQHLKTQ